jgi:cytochrome P450
MDTGRDALRAWRKEGILASLRELRDALGPVFRIPLPGFNPVVVSGPEANRYVLVTARHRLNWRMERDPVVRLLRHGVLVEDGQAHDDLRRALSPPLHKLAVPAYLPAMVRAVDRVEARWVSGSSVDMLPEMRRITLLILAETLFGVDLAPDLERLWKPILRLLAHISPGPWVIWPAAPRWGHRGARRAVDEYLYRIIRDRRRNPSGHDLLTHLVRDTPLGDDAIRDQLLTMLIAGHDTTTALLAWALVLLGRHPDSMDRARAEIDATIGDGVPTGESLEAMLYLEAVVHETLRLYPPIHLGNRRTLEDLDLEGYRLPRGRRLLYSIYLTHRDPEVWPDPDRYDPERFLGGKRSLPYAYLPFGGGPRNCIGAHYGLVEGKAVLARLLQGWDLKLLDRPIHPHMGATLEPRPGVWMQVERRTA